MKTSKAIKRSVVAVIGGTVILFGVALLVLPGPGLAVIAVGVGILATEFVWAKCLFAKAKRKAHEAAEHIKHLDGFGKDEGEDAAGKEEEQARGPLPECQRKASPAADGHRS